MSCPQGAGPPGGEEGYLHGKEPHQGEGSSLGGSGYGSHLGRRNRVAELPHHQEQVRGLSPLQKPGSPQMEIQGMEEEALPGAARGLPCPLLWVTWRAWMDETPGWWQELAMVPGVDNHKKLACEVWASFQLPQRASKGHWVENDHQAPVALLCLHQKNFPLLPNSKFTCQDIQELQREKIVTYAKALQFWVEKANLPTKGQPCLLVGSVVELREEMKCYISFSDKDVFSGVALLEESPITPPKEATLEGAQPAPANSPVKEATMDVTMEPTREKKPLNQFPGWEKVLHPSRQVVAAGQIPPLSRALSRCLIVRVWGEGWFDNLKLTNQGCQPPSQNTPHTPKSQRLSGKQCHHLVLPK